jgi:hypothetical protein
VRLQRQQTELMDVDVLCVDDCAGVLMTVLMVDDCVDVLMLVFMG